LENNLNELFSGFMRRYLENRTRYDQSYYQWPIVGSRVFSCFIDFNKAFDEASYWKLFTKLLDDDVNVNAVGVLAFWYSRQQMYSMSNSRMQYRTGGFLIIFCQFLSAR